VIAELTDGGVDYSLVHGKCGGDAGSPGVLHKGWGESDHAVWPEHGRRSPPAVSSWSRRVWGGYGLRRSARRKRTAWLTEWERFEKGEIRFDTFIQHTPASRRSTGFDLMHAGQSIAL